MSKVAILGFDGLDPLLIDKWRDLLPNFRSLYNNLSEIVIQSTFPPDSICAWASIFTGENPAQHGLIESINYLSDKKIAGAEDRSSYIKGKTFWDIAGKMGKSVCVINPFIAYPAWDVNGIMVSGPVFEGGDTSTYPENILKEFRLPPLGGMVDFPDEKTLGKFLDDARELTVQLAEVGLEMYKNKNPDLFFLTFLTSDRIKHFFWRFGDKGDIYYPGDNPYENVIKEFYMLLDEVTGKFLETIDKDTTLIIISDHGHRRRCSHNLNLNEVLRRKGYLAVDDRGMMGFLKKCFERTKVLTIGSLSELGMQDYIYKIAKFVPNRKSLKKASYLIDKKESPVTISNVCGTNPYGGLEIRTSEDKYEELRDAVINDLLSFDKESGRSIFKWVRKRELIYKGRREDRLPDILFELNEEYGIGMDLYTKLVTKNFTHKKISGGHKMEAVLLTNINNVNIKNIQRPDSIIGMKDFIMDILLS